MKDSAVITLKKGEGRLLKSGGAWIFDNEIADIKGSFLNGDVVSVRDFDGYPMGKGVINMNSKIRVRMLTRDRQRVSHEKTESGLGLSQENCRHKQLPHCLRRC